MTTYAELKGELEFADRSQAIASQPLRSKLGDYFDISRGNAVYDLRVARESLFNAMVGDRLPNIDETETIADSEKGLEVVYTRITGGKHTAQELVREDKSDITTLLNAKLGIQQTDR